MVLQHSLVGKSLHWHVVQCQSRDFPIKLCYNTIIHLLFHYFLSLGSLLDLGFFVIAYSCTGVTVLLG